MTTLAPVIRLTAPIMSVYGEEAFNQLSEKEKNYAYYFYKASWEGSKICYFQKSFESPALFLLFQCIFTGQSIEQLQQTSGLSTDDYQGLLAYVASVLNNCGNYQNFGDSKFIPIIPFETLLKVTQSSQNYQSKQWSSIMDELLDYAKEGIYRYDGKYSKIGFVEEDGLNGYYSPNLSKQEIDDVDEFLSIIGISCLNTRIIKDTVEKVIKVLIMSSHSQPVRNHYYKTQRIEIHFGHLSPLLRRVSENLSKALKYAANKNQENMLKSYVEHFNTGDIQIHKESQRWWIKDKGPVIETNIGFIETYGDPKQVRAEFEGFVAMVDKKLSESTNRVVDQADLFTNQLPWPKAFEKDTFLRPDFTSLTVLAFGSSGTPLGINIPNYDDIRQEEGFKNVLLNTIPRITDVLFLDQEDANIIKEFYSQAMFHKVIYHELIGHGSGKIFQPRQDGSLNYDPKIINPLTGQEIGQTFYNSNDTWSGKFQALSNPYEECRADSVALFFSNFKEAFQVLQPQEAANWEKIRSCIYLEFIYNGIMGLQIYNSEAKKWGQAHTNGRFVILQVLLEAGEDMIKIIECKNGDGKDSIQVKIKKELFGTIGLKAMSDFLVKLQVYKSTGDLEGAQKLFGKYSEVDERFLRIRDIVIANKKPRRLELQANIVRDGQQFIYKTYPETFTGVINSYFDRFSLFDYEFYEQWKDLAHIMKY